MLTRTIWPAQVTAMELTAGFALLASIPEEAACSRHAPVKSCFVYFAKYAISPSLAIAISAMSRIEIRDSTRVNPFPDLKI